MKKKCAPQQRMNRLTVILALSMLLSALFSNRGIVLFGADTHLYNFVHGFVFGLLLCTVIAMIITYFRLSSSKEKPDADSF